MIANPKATVEQINIRRSLVSLSSEETNCFRISKKDRREKSIGMLLDLKSSGYIKMHSLPDLIKVSLAQSKTQDDNPCS
jgi:hypothetical protein